MLRKSDINQATSGSPWDFSNEVLYDLCRQYPNHKDQGATLTKILFIGRVYAAAIERRKTKNQKNDNLYIETVEPELRKSDIDKWLRIARKAKPNHPSALDVMVDIHGNLTELFSEISEHDNRSLASKYLHFHVPQLFYIYDSRAANGLSHLSILVGRASNNRGLGDNEYRKFAEKCSRLKRYCANQFGVDLSPRQLDNLLLSKSRL
jgi:hypothetical protein